MTPEEKQSELKRNRDIVLATIDYLIKTERDRIRFDQIDPDTSFYEHLKQETERCYKKRRLKSLQKMLGHMTARPRLTGDTGFAAYIKEKTGFDIDIFENIRERIDNIFQQKTIKTENEYHDAIAMISLYEQTFVDQEKIDMLNKLCIDFKDRESKRKPSGRHQLIITTRDLKTFSNSYSPDNKRSVTVAENDADINDPLTQVVVFFEKATGIVYSVKRINLDIKTYWKDNNTIIIETKKDYVAVAKHKQVQSFQNIVRIEYIER